MSPLQAFEIARRLEEHPHIARVHYPGLPSHPDHSIAVQQMHGFGGVISFEVGCPGCCAPVFLSATMVLHALQLLSSMMCTPVCSTFCSQFGAVGKLMSAMVGPHHALSC